MKIPWFWISTCVLILFLGITFGLLLAKEFSGWGFTIFTGFICLIAGLAGGAYIADQQ